MNAASGQTRIDADELLHLIPDIIPTRENINRFEQENILAAREWAMRRRVLTRAEIFSEAFLLKLHRRMYGDVWKWAGKLRTGNTNLGVDYFLIGAELRQLLEDARYWLAHQTYETGDLAVIFHHRLVKIHLFKNGNGRHARMCADMIAAKYKQRPLSWGGNFDLTEPDALRKRYILALQDADRGDYRALLRFAKA